MLILAALAIVMALLPLVLTTHVGMAIGLMLGAAAFGIVPLLPPRGQDCRQPSRIGPSP